MRQQDIKLGAFYIGRNGAGPREVWGMSDGYVYWRDRFGDGGCFLTSFAAWASAEVSPDPSIARAARARAGEERLLMEAVVKMVKDWCK